MKTNSTAIEKSIIEGASHHLERLESWSIGASVFLKDGRESSIQRHFSSCLALCDLSDENKGLTKSARMELEKIREKAVKAHPNFTLWATSVLKPRIDKGFVRNEPVL